MHIFSSHSKRVYKDQPATWTLEPPTRRLNSSESTDNLIRCSSVMALLARPWNRAPTMYAAAVSSPYTTWYILARLLWALGRATYTCQRHQIIIRLEVFRSHHDPSCSGSKTDNHDGQPQQRKGLCNKTHDPDEIGFLYEMKLILWGRIRIKRQVTEGRVFRCFPQHFLLLEPGRTKPDPNPVDL